jgi:NADPH-dependent 2,4-dienoyl-CoA reductase/sulfur reductase-like enzyme
VTSADATRVANQYIQPDRFAVIVVGDLAKIEKGDPRGESRSREGCHDRRGAEVAPSAQPIVIVGAGAAGLVAAIFAARQGARVVLLERTTDGGRKILISGGGRCNILPRALEPERFVSESPVLVRRLLRSWPLTGQRDSSNGISESR